MLLLPVLLPCLQGVVCGVNDLHITNASDLIDFSNKVNSGESYNGTTVFLDNDVDFSGCLSEQFDPIGKGSKYNFRGTFDGQGHTISNLAMNSSERFVGLFGYTYWATIMNVVLDSSCSISSAYTSSSWPYVGGITVYCSSCTIESSVNMGKVTFIGNTDNNLFLGGIAGWLFIEVTVRNCANYGSVTHSGTAGIAYIGGIVGESYGSSSKHIQNCLNYGEIKHSGTTSNNSYIGGILGYALYGVNILENCVSAGKITLNTTNDFIGSIVGYARSGSTVNITHCFWTSDMGNFNACGGEDSSTKVTITETSLVTINTTTVDNLNSYNNSWNKWLLNSNSKSVTFKVNNGKGFILSTQLIVLPSLAESGGHAFSGWFEDEKCATKEFSKSFVEDSTTLYGGWSYIMTFDYGNGTAVSETLSYNASINYPDNPTREGYTFSGWSPNPERMPASDTTVIAQWTEEVASEFVEIVFDTKDMTKKDVEDLVKRLTDEEFEIIRFEDNSSGEMRVIIKFKDKTVAENFVETISASSDSEVKGVVKVSFSLEKTDSSSLKFIPFFALGFALL